MSLWAHCIFEGWTGLRGILWFHSALSGLIHTASCTWHLCKTNGGMRFIIRSGSAQSGLPHSHSQTWVARVICPRCGPTCFFAIFVETMTICNDICPPRSLLVSRGVHTSTQLSQLVMRMHAAELRWRHMYNVYQVIASLRTSNSAGASACCNII